MKREILCGKCGSLRPMHPEDVANGVERRRVHLRLARAAICDHCDEHIEAQAEAVAVTWWYRCREGTPYDWEQEFGTPL